MPVIETTISSTATGTYGLINDLIGQFKTIILNDPNVIIFSDNNPDAETARNLMYTVAGTNRYFKMLAYTGNVFDFGIWRNDINIWEPSWPLEYSSPYNHFFRYGVSADAFVSGANYPVTFVWGEKLHLLHGSVGDDGTNPVKQTIFWAMNVGDSTGWYMLSTAPNIQYIYRNILDAEECLMLIFGGFDLPLYGGSFIGIEARFHDHYPEHITVLNYYYGGFCVNIPDNLGTGIHHDNEGNSYFIDCDSSPTYLIKISSAEEYQEWSNYPGSFVKTSDYPYQCILYFSTTNKYYLVVSTSQFYHRYYLGTYRLSPITSGTNGKRYEYVSGQWSHVEDYNNIGTTDTMMDWETDAMQEANADTFTDIDMTTIYFAKTTP